MYDTMVRHELLDSYRTDKIDEMSDKESDANARKQIAIKTAADGQKIIQNSQ